MNDVITPIGRTGQQAGIGYALTVLLSTVFHLKLAPDVQAALAVALAWAVSVVQNLAESAGHRILPTWGKPVAPPGDPVTNG